MFENRSDMRGHEKASVTAGLVLGNPRFRFRCGFQPRRRAAKIRRWAFKGWWLCLRQVAGQMLPDRPDTGRRFRGAQ